MLELAQGVCDGSIPGLRVHPKKGSAVMFDYAKPEDAELLWHLGCDMAEQQGTGTAADAKETKYCVQKFKEIAVPDRRLGRGARYNQIYDAVAEKLEGFDANKDGLLTVLELRQLLDSAGESLANVDAGVLVSQSDLNGDGQLDAEEAAFRFKTHISSEAFWVQ